MANRQKSLSSFFKAGPKTDLFAQVPAPKEEKEIVKEKKLTKRKRDSDEEEEELVREVKKSRKTKAHTGPTLDEDLELPDDSDEEPKEEEKKQSSKETTKQAEEMATEEEVIPAVPESPKKEVATKSPKKEVVTKSPKKEVAKKEVAKKEEVATKSPKKEVVKKEVAKKEVVKKGAAAKSAALDSPKKGAPEDSISEEEEDFVITEEQIKAEVKKPLVEEKSGAHVWKEGEPVKYSEFANALQAASETRGRLEQTSIMCSFFRKVIQFSPQDLTKCVYLATNTLAPPYMGIELGVGESLITKAISEATGKSKATITKDYQNKGDLGLVAEASVCNLRTLVAPKPLTVARVHQQFLEIAKISGNSSQQKRTDKIRQMLVDCRGPEAKFIVKALQGKMRIGLGPKTVLAGLAHAFVYELDEKKPTPERFSKAVETLEQAYNQQPNWDGVVEAVMKEGIDKLLDNIHLVLGIPFAPMLAQPTKGIDEIFERLKGKTFTAEWKYDGERAQIHMLEDGTVKVFSRNLDDTTPKFPDIVEGVKAAVKEGVTSFVLDCEAVAYDTVEDKILPFQILSTRAKKSVELSQVRVKVCLFVFDLVCLNGVSMIKDSLAERRKKLHSSFQEVKGFFLFAKAKDLMEPEEINAWLEESVAGNCEGLMVKTLEVDATYQAAKRAYQWLKVKKDYLEGMGDTLDLVPIGGYIGKGKRTGFYGGFLLACYDDDSEEYQTICKIGTGFSDQQLSEFSKALEKTIVPTCKSYFRVGDSKDPDVWFEPSVVWEVKAADLSISPVHQAGIGILSDEKGIALRFPRLVRVREDKTPEQATTARQVVEMYKNQKINHNFK
eukprot:TRINITY_DN7675_c0_g1_i1.p1 TRINITY_DN7675_c0_g1~~TRINITY_DN7675_c0_g1_i1.p1  ORF type:complete len:838 (-),score=280.43 TRINITY_DN7675_c0_g1_i1:57-2570(-)